MRGSVGHRARAVSAAAVLLGTLLLAYVPSNAASVFALTPDASASPDPIASPSPDPIASPSPDPIASPSPDPIASPSPDPIASPSPAPNPAATVRLHLTTDAPAEGRHRIDPGAQLRVTVGVTTAEDQPASSLSVIVPAGWSIVDGGGGTYDGNLGRVVWDLDPIGAGISVDRLVTLRAPTSSPVDGGLDFEATFASRLEVAGGLAIGPSATILVAPAPNPAATVRLHLTTDAPVEGRHRIDPGSQLRVTVGLTTAEDQPASSLSVIVPAGWSIVDGGGGTYDGNLGRVVWDLDPIGAGISVDRLVTLRAPTSSPVDGGLDFEATFASRLEVAGGLAIGPSATILVAPLVEVEHSTVGEVPDLTLTPTYVPEDEPLANVQRFSMVRIRFQVRNEGDRPVTILPRLEYRPTWGAAFATVPGGENVDGVGFYVGPEWVSSGLPGGGTRLGPEAEPIGVDAIRSHDTSDTSQTRTVGRHSMGPNPAGLLSLPGMSYTEIEFTIRPTTDARYLESYEFRITDAGTAFIGAVIATLRMGAEPPLLESPVQNPGVAVGPAPNLDPALAYSLAQPRSTQSTAPALQPVGPAGGHPMGLAPDTSPDLQYRLVQPGSLSSGLPTTAPTASAVGSTTYVLVTPAAPGGMARDIHGPYD